MSDIQECPSGHLSGHATGCPAGASASCPGTGWVGSPGWAMELSPELAWPGTAVWMRQCESCFLLLSMQMGGNQGLS